MMGIGKNFQYTSKLVFIKCVHISYFQSTSIFIETAGSFRLVISASVRSLTNPMISRYNMGPGEHRIFRRKYSTKHCFDEMEI